MCLIIHRKTLYTTKTTTLNMIEEVQCEENRIEMQLNNIVFELCVNQLVNIYETRKV